MLTIEQRATELEQNGTMGAGRRRAVNRMIDGIVSMKHCQLLSTWFESYGVENGEVRRLSQLGRDEPINLVTLSDNAFGLTIRTIRTADTKNRI